MIELRPHLEAFLGELFSHQPVLATIMGDHRFDGRWPDYGDPELAPFTGMLERWSGTFAAIEPSTLGPDDVIDRDLLGDEIRRMLFEVSDLAEHRWNALGYIYECGTGFFALLAREFAPLADRVASIAQRAEGLPAYFDGAATSLTGTSDRPVSVLHLEKALAQLDGIAHLIAQAREEARATLDRGNDPALAAAIARLAAAEPPARAAVESFRDHLERVVRPRASGDGRLGRERFDRKLRWTLRSDLSADEILRRAEGDRERVTAEMLRLAREMWPTWLPDRPMPTAEAAGSAVAAERETIRLALDAVAAYHGPVEEILERCRSNVDALESFITERGLLDAPDEPLEVIWTPLFLRSFGGGYLDPPGPLERGQKSFFGFTPPADDATPERVESFLREQNDRMLTVVTIHETVPGHYLQLWYANCRGTLARAVFGSGVFAEGWAVYVTQVMMDLGYAGDDLGLLLTHWKMYLRAAINAILDVRVHAGVGGPIDEAEALRLMMEDGFQEEHEARAKWDRARLSSTQLSTYFVGSSEMWDIEVEARRRAARAAGHGGAIPEARVVGGLGDTPGFSYPAHLRAVLSHGSPPIPVLRRILFGAPPPPA